MCNNRCENCKTNTENYHSGPYINLNKKIILRSAVLILFISAHTRIYIFLRHFITNYDFDMRKYNSFSSSHTKSCMISYFSLVNMLYRYDKI